MPSKLMATPSELLEFWNVDGMGLSPSLNSFWRNRNVAPASLLRLTFNVAAARDPVEPGSCASRTRWYTPESGAPVAPIETRPFPFVLTSQFWFRLYGGIGGVVVEGSKPSVNVKLDEVLVKGVELP